MAVRLSLLWRRRVAPIVAAPPTGGTIGLSLATKTTARSVNGLGMSNGAAGAAGRTALPGARQIARAMAVNRPAHAAGLLSAGPRNGARRREAGDCRVGIGPAERPA
ncbi:hypothetical protein [Sphingomonas morindae]|uniref:Uncharacterized protein n=1 Tax=Sphingomonas morindae TaxID=1541170 RepID=A0ABY4XCM0_9SPHN|nr:hypothetical protein [Sphingomonas morindae]USI74640.1 hypothetical protein LHA26_00320 [Sphingomonas morindae]